MMCCHDPKFDSPATRDGWVRIDPQALADVAMHRHEIARYDAAWDATTLTVDGTVFWFPGRAA